MQLLHERPPLLNYLRTSLFSRPKFWVDYEGTQYWSDVVNVIAHEETDVEVPLEQLALNLTNDPNPVRFDGKPPVFRPEQIRMASIGSLVGILSQTVVANTSSPRVYYYLNDHLGTPQVITDEDGEIIWKADFKPFGEATVDLASITTNNFRLPGQYYDEETGLHYNWHRYYDPKTGRYLRGDPSHSVQPRGTNIPYLLLSLLTTPNELNLYPYVKNNPINKEDPFGLCEEKKCNTPWHVCVPRCRNYFSVAPDGTPPSPPSIIYDGAVSYFCMAICGINPCSFDDPKYDEPFWW